MHRGLEAGFELDRLWHALRGEMEDSRRADLERLARVLGDSGIVYAVIGGVAVQIHLPDPRTTLDVGVAVLSLEDLPVAALEQEGFVRTGVFAHSENWLAPGRTPVQFTDDPALRSAVANAESVDAGGLLLRVLTRGDLLHEKVRSGSDAARRGSKRLQDLADARALLEADSGLSALLSAAERALLDSLPA